MATNEVRRIQQQLRNAIEGGAWHGPAVNEIIGELTAQQAAARPLDGAHSPWEIVVHMAVWIEIARRRIEGEDARPSAADDWPAVPEPTEEAWAEARNRLSLAHEALQTTLEEFAESDLEDQVIGQDYDAYFMLHGAIQHTLYHAGQIAVLRKTL